MRILILGASGLIGHKLLERLGERFGDVHGTLLQSRERFAGNRLFSGRNVVDHVDVRDFDKLAGLMEAIRPDVILNCAGITKRRPEINDPLHAIAVNALFPHKLVNWTHPRGIRVIHFSTDCVFDGSTGNYTEESLTTAKDAYGRTKAMGEIRSDKGLTIRSSFIGRELYAHSELLDWFLAQRGKSIKGYSRAFYTGISTLEMVRIVGDIIERRPDLSGLYQLSMNRKISKYDLLCQARDVFNLPVDIAPDDGPMIDASLDSSLLRLTFDPALPDWPEMLRGIAADPFPYPVLS